MIEIDVKSMVDNIRADLKKEIQGFVRPPHLATVLVGNDAPSEKYVANKIKLCMDLGVSFSVFRVKEENVKYELEPLLYRLSSDHTYHSILLQLPLPDGQDPTRFINQINPNKDVDGLTTENQGLLFQGQPTVPPCTPLGILEILRQIGVGVIGARVCVIGKSNLLGKPLAQMLSNMGATVFNCDSKTYNLDTLVGISDIVIPCTGHHGVVTPDMLKYNAIVIDAGISYKDGKMVGDFDPTELLTVNDIQYTPVPRGVGLMTTTMLIKNLLQCYKIQEGLI